MMGGAGAVACGYDGLTFDGPGQGYALWTQNLHFRPDWEHVISPVVDFALNREGVDPQRIAIQGIRQGGDQGQLVSAADVEATWTDTLRAVRAGMLSIPSRISGRLPTLTRSDGGVIEEERRAARELAARGETP